MVDKVKILIMGLDNSGKSCILLSLRGNTNLLSILHLKPTKGIDIQQFESYDTNISVWDFGGQEVYRKDYLSNIKKYLTLTNKVIFVIDVQDKERYQQALDYLKTVVKDLEDDIELSIYLHKYDPNLQSIDGFEDIDDIVNKELIDSLKEIVPKNIDTKVFKTSVFTVFEKNFINIFGS